MSNVRVNLMKSLVYFLLYLSLTACAQSPVREATPTPNYSDLSISMKRSPCFGTCPVYQLEIDGAGNVSYEGLMFVAIEGKQSTRISPAQIQELGEAIEAAKFFTLKDSYDVPWTDLPSVMLSITLNGESKTIQHYGTLLCNGDLDEAPKELCDLENKIDEVVNSKQWVGQYGCVVFSLPSPSGRGEASSRFNVS